MTLAFSRHPLLTVLSQAGHGTCGRFSAQTGDQVWSFWFRDGAMRAVDTVHPKFSWAQFVDFIPGLSDSDRKNLRQVLRFGGTTLHAALQELGMNEQSADTMLARGAEAIWSRIFSDTSAKLGWQAMSELPPDAFELGLDRLYLIALSRTATPKQVRELALSLGTVELQIVPAEKLKSMKLLGVEQATFSRLTAQSVEEALQEISERDQNKVAAVLVVAALLGVIEPTQSDAGLDTAPVIEAEAAVILPAAEDDPTTLPAAPWWDKQDVVTAYEMLGGTPNDSRRELTALYQKALRELDEAGHSARESQRYRRWLVTAFSIATQDDVTSLYIQVQREGLRGVRAIAEVQTRLGKMLVDQALVLARKGDLGGAYPILLRAHETTPDNADSAALLGALTISGHPAIEFDPVKGLEYIQTATDLDSQRATFKYWEGVILEWLQQPQNAATAYTACLTLDPEHPAARERLDRLSA